MLQLQLPGPRRMSRAAAVLSPLLAMSLVVFAASAQDTTVPSEDLRAALAKADAGDGADLLKLADGGRADAQAYAGIMLIFGRGTIAADPRRGCAYAEKASASRPEAVYMTGECYRRGLNGPPDMAKAKAAFTRADQMGFPKAKCALGEMQMAEPGGGAQGLELCKTAAKAGDRDAQMKVAETYRKGGPVAADPAEARKWYQMAADRQDPEAARVLGEMYAKGEGGKKDTKKALSLWQAAEKAGDPLAPILVADQLFSEMTGGKTPGPGQYAFRGGIPVADIDAISDWYRQALERDPRPDVKKRAQTALNVLASFKTAAKSNP
jgi:TPR repeat protein